MAADLRPPMASALEAFGLAIQVRYPPPVGTQLTTTGIWVPDLREAAPFGTDFQNLGARKVMAVERTDSLRSVPRGSIITAPEYDGGPAKTWRVDGYDGPVESEVIRLIVVETSAC